MSKPTTLSTMTDTAAAAGVADDVPEPYLVKMPNPAHAKARRLWWVTLGSRILVVLILIGIWQLLSNYISPITISSPSAVYHALIHYAENDLWEDLLATMEEVVFGYAIGVAAGIILGIAFASVPLIANTFEPFIIGLYGVPKIAFGPLLVVWLGIGMTPKVTLAAVMTFFVVFFSSYDGIRNVDKGQLNAVRLMGASRLQMRRYVIFPGARKNIFLGMKLGVPEALVGAIVGEFISSTKGVGYSIEFATAQLNTAGVFAGLIVLTVLSIALNAAVKVIARKVDPETDGASIL
jgi:NitT/TauT family transport system permease protein